MRTALRSLLSTAYFFFFNDTATTEIYTLSLHDALPISIEYECPPQTAGVRCGEETRQRWRNGHESVRGPTGNPLGQAEQRMHAAGAGIEQAIVVDLEDALGIGDLGRDLEAVLPVRKQAVTEIGRASCRERV